MKTITTLTLSLLCTVTLQAQWIPGGFPLNDTLDANEYAYPEMAADGHGGAYIGWEDISRRPKHVYVQRVSREGRLLWGPDGVRLSEPDTTKWTHQIGVKLLRCNDQFVYAVWYAPPYVRAQKLDTAGRRYWAPEGIIVNPARKGYFSSVALDSAGGLFITSIHPDSVDPVNSERVWTQWIQRIDSSGRLLWSDSCVVLSHTVVGPVADQCVISASVPGQAYVAWTDMMSNLQDGDNQTFVQRFDENGRALWHENGLRITEHMSRDNRQLWMTADDRGGIFVFWVSDGKGDWQYFQMVQHLDSSGLRLAGLEGEQLFTGTSYKDILSDGNGGFYIYFKYSVGLSSEATYFLEAQHYDGKLSRSHWRNIERPDHPGINVVDVLGRRRGWGDYPASSVALDGAGGLFIVGPGELTTVYRIPGIWVQWVDNRGRTRWNGESLPFPIDTAYVLGKTIYLGELGFRSHITIRATAPGEAFVIWIDSRSGARHPYLAKVTRDGVVNVQPLVPQHDASFSLRYAYPQPVVDNAQVAGEIVQGGVITVAVYDLGGREISRVFDGWRDPGLFEIPVSLKGVAPGAYFIHARLGTQESNIPIIVTGRRK